MGDSSCLFEKIPHVIVGQPHIEHFDCRLGVEMYMFAKVNISEAAPSQQLNKVIVPKLLANTGPGEIPFPVFHLDAPQPAFQTCTVAS
jgi:hypothetical protein